MAAESLARNADSKRKFLEFLAIYGITYFVGLLAVSYYWGSLLLFVLLGWLGVAALIPFVIGLCLRKWRMAVVCAGIVLFPWLYELLGTHFKAGKFQAAKDYVTKVAPVLERYRAEHQAYPADVSELQRPPWFLQYHGDGGGYWFIYDDPWEIMNFYEYSSGDRDWHLHT